MSVIDKTLMRKLPDPHTTRGLVIWSLLFLLFVESIWTINYLTPTSSTTTLLSKPPSVQNARPITSEVAAAQPAISPDATSVMSLTTETKNPKLNQPFKVAVHLNTTDKPVDGTTVKLQFDTAMLQVAGTNPAQVGAMFPLVLNNRTEGNTVLISAVSNPTGPFFKGTDVVATVVFTPKKVGQTDIKIQFSPGVTTDSNVVSHEHAGQDILGEVENLSVAIE